MDLGVYVVTRPRSDGTHRVAFEVPARHRPDNWPPTIPLPYEKRIGNLSDPDECSRIRDDAQALYAKLMTMKVRPQEPTKRQTWDVLIGLWQATSKYEALKPVTKHNYGIYIKRIVTYLKAHPELQPSTIKESDIDAMLTTWNHCQDMKVDAHMIMKALMKKAVKEGWRLDNPMSDIICVRPSKKERSVVIWEPEDVEFLTAACVDAGQDSVAGIILAVWEVGQRLTDTRNFRLGVEYIDSVFRFHQSKTGKYVTIPATAGFSKLIESGKSEGDYLFPAPGEQSPFTEIGLGQTFARIRNEFPKYAESGLCLRHLRHSCVVQLARAGCTIPEIASITGHSMNTVHVILEHYLPKDNQLAFNAIEKRRRMVEERMQLAA